MTPFLLDYLCEPITKLPLSLHNARIENESKYSRLKRRFKATSLNTFDWFGSHEYQHHKSDDDIKNLLRQLQPDQSKVKNIDKYFQRPPYIGCALRIGR